MPIKTTGLLNYWSIKTTAIKNVSIKNYCWQIMCQSKLLSYQIKCQSKLLGCKNYMSVKTTKVSNNCLNQNYGTVKRCFNKTYRAVKRNQSRQKKSMQLGTSVIVYCITSTANDIISSAYSNQSTLLPFLIRNSNHCATDIAQGHWETEIEIMDIWNWNWLNGVIDISSWNCRQWQS